MKSTSTAPIVKCKCGNAGDFFCMDHKTHICERELAKHKCVVKKTKEVDLELKRSVQKLEKEWPTWRTRLQNELSEHLQAKLAPLRELQTEIVRSTEQLVEGYQRNLTSLVEHKILNERKEKVERIFAAEKSRNLSDLMTLLSATESLDFEKNRIDLKYYFENDDLFKLAQSFLSLAARLITSASTAFSSKFTVERPDTVEDEVRKNTVHVLLAESNRLFAGKISLLQSHLLGQSKLQPRKFADTIEDTSMPRETVQRPKGGNKASIKTQARTYSGNAINESLVESGGSFRNIEELESDRRLEEVSSVVEDKFDFDLDDEDFDFGDDEVIEKENRTDELRAVFENSHQRLMRVLDRALYDMNCPGFYDKAYRENANTYMDGFKETLESILKEVKNYFNRL